MAQQGEDDCGSCTLRTCYVGSSGGESPGGSRQIFVEVELTFCLTLGGIDRFIARLFGLKFLLPTPHLLANWQ